MSRRVTLRVQPPMPFGDVTIMPAPLSGRPEADMARAMAAALADVEAPTAAEVYNRLRQAFPIGALERTRRCPCELDGSSSAAGALSRATCHRS